MSSATDEKMIVFSDLDGSLLDHDSYDWHPARPALEMLKSLDIPLVLVSSKTLAELEDYRSQLDLQHPVVAENGAAVHIPDDYFPASATYPAGMVSRSELQSAYAAVKAAEAFDCEAFYELGVSGIIRETGLSQQQAMRANDRKASEPILWLDSDGRAAEFERQMKTRGLRCIRGGRFLHLMGDTDKEEAVRQLLDAYSEKWPGKTLASVSLGDGPNDLGMLACTDVAVVIPGKHEHDMTLDTQNRILRPTSPGPAGWNEAMLVLLAERQDNSPSAHNNGE